MLLGCFEDAALQRHGLSRRPSLPPHPTERPAAAGANALECSRACARYAYFAVGSERLVGGACLCGDLPLLSWRRDAEGMDGLRKKGLWAVRG